MVTDVFRATTTICTAFANGCKDIIPVATEAEALTYKGMGYLTGAEHSTERCSFADFGNSPAEYSVARVSGKSLVMKTTNGTIAIKGAADCHSLLIGAFVNLQAVAMRCKELDRDVLIVCSGSDGRICLEDFYKAYERRGSVFMDYRNSIDTFNKNTIIYGHNYLDSTMFSDLENYKDIEFYKTAPVIECNTIYKNYKWKVFAVFLTTASPELDNGYVFNYIYPFMTDENFAEFIAEVQKRSLYHTDVEVLPTDKILTLQTCTRDLDLSPRKQEDARCIVMARLVREGESETVDVTKAVQNENPKYPQLYYDKYKLENPYRNDEQWYPRGE